MRRSLPDGHAFPAGLEASWAVARLPCFVCCLFSFVCFVFVVVFSPLSCLLSCFCIVFFSSRLVLSCVVVFSCFFVLQKTRDALRVTPSWSDCLFARKFVSPLGERLFWQHLAREKCHTRTAEKITLNVGIEPRRHKYHTHIARTICDMSS